MDFDIGNILYIVITIVAVLVGVLGKKKKPAPGETGEPGAERRPSFLENLERVLNQGQEGSMVADLKPYEEDLPAEDMQEAVSDETYKNPSQGPGLMEQYESIMNRSTERDSNFDGAEIESMIESLEVEDLDYVSGTDYFEIVKDFDAGTAVVYSAIINRLDI